MTDWVNVGFRDQLRIIETSKDDCLKKCSIFLQSLMTDVCQEIKQDRSRQHITMKSTSGCYRVPSTLCRFADETFFSEWERKCPAKYIQTYFRKSESAQRHVQQTVWISAQLNSHTGNWKSWCMIRLHYAKLVGAILGTWLMRSIVLY